eukprot:TRINITY_DN17629_c0_g1_i1.p1 TRINITY_DN17629_c0_g1~~TRINITY_DN17629_c0_g1_i1.p1  ORF type:complete len:240 (+),score=62.54 TRINITY_DN17629_c0_g1_i1:48-722(+)
MGSDPLDNTLRSFVSAVFDDDVEEENEAPVEPESKGPTMLSPGARGRRARSQTITNFVSSVFDDAENTGISDMDTSEISTSVATGTPETRPRGMSSTAMTEDGIDVMVRWAGELFGDSANVLDTTGDGKIDTIILDSTGDGIQDTKLPASCIDTNGDGNIDTMIVAGKTLSLKGRELPAPPPTTATTPEDKQQLTKSVAEALAQVKAARKEKARLRQASLKENE